MAFLLVVLAVSALLGLFVVFPACRLAAAADRCTPNDELVARSQ
jgi:hypothetical protein